MNRRQLLKTGITSAVVAGVSGCLGYTVQSVDDVEKRKNKITKAKSNNTKLDENNTELQSTNRELQKKVKELNTTNQELQNEAEELNITNSRLRSNNSELQSNLSTLEKNIDTLESEKTELENELDDSENEVEQIQNKLDAVNVDLQKARAKQILYLYSYGLTDQNNAVNSYNDALSYYNDQDYGAANGEFNLAAGFYFAASVNFAGAKNRANEFRYSTVADYSQTAETRMEEMYNACLKFGKASKDYDDGNVSDGDDKRSQGNEYYSSAQEKELEDLSALETILGVSLDI